MKVSFLAIVFIYVGLPLVNCYYDCGSNVGSYLGASIPGCDADETCVFIRGTNVTIEIDFETYVDSDAITAVAHIATLNIALPVKVQNPDGCKDSGIQCPITKAQKYKYIGSFPVLKEYIGISVYLHWELKDKYYKKLVCVEIKGKFK